MDAFRSRSLKIAPRKTAAAAILAVLLVSGCRFGNQVVKATDPTKKSGFYKSEPASMTLCVFLEGRAAQCVPAPLSLIPDSITEVMTNPVYVAANSTQAKAYLLPNSLDASAVFEMSMDASGQLTGTPYADEPQSFWIDPACLSQVQIQKEGLIREADGSTPTAIGDFKISGSVDFSVGVLTALGGQCSSTLQLMQGCYADAELCPGATLQERQAEQQSIQEFFSPYVSNGALAADDLPLLQGMGWEVSYQ